MKKFIVSAARCAVLAAALLVGFNFAAQAAGNPLIEMNTSGSPMKDSAMVKMSEEIKAYLAPLASIRVPVYVKEIKKVKKVTQVHFADLMNDYPYRDETIKGMYEIARPYFPGKKIELWINGKPIEQMKSRYYSSLDESGNQPSRYNPPKKKKNAVQPALVSEENLPYTITKGLAGRHIGMWQSHGYYFENKLQRWEWQRAKLLETIEDLYTQSYVLPFLVPMLENAGAVVLLPRERDIQKTEILVDNNASYAGCENTGLYMESEGSNAWNNSIEPGFANAQKVWEFGQNPFKAGNYRCAKMVRKGSDQKASTVCWLPKVPKTGEYGVYVSYASLPNSTDAAEYTVKFKGGSKQFKVNQKMAGGMWVYLGKFLFDKGSDTQGVYLSNESESKNASKLVVTADGVKFGGGMGNMARSSTSVLPYEMEPVTSGMPRFTEGSRYWLQWSGFADSIYSSTNNINDYQDDYTSRGRWINALVGGSDRNPKAPGYKVPVDLSFAFHTDAGTFKDDSIVGTLSIYTRFSNDSDKYANGEDRMLGREYADIVQTEIVNDVRALYEPSWSRRGLWDRSYSESRSPEVPAMLLEFLSHQNFADLKYGLNPEFRFTVSRAIYKGMVKFLSVRYQTPYVIAPLPVKDFKAELVDGGASLSWAPTEDKLEPTAVAKRYIVYTRIDDNAFDNGVVVDSPHYVVKGLEAGKIYSFKVEALNEGGKSFPSEVLAVGIPAAGNVNRVALVVNGFTRLSAPYFFQKDSSFAGFYDRKDFGVPYLYDISYIGSQYEYRRSIPWFDDDSAGFGACYDDKADEVIAGNTFDFVYAHGKALMANGYAFASSSLGAVENGNFLNSYYMVDFILGKQMQTMMGNGKVPVKYETYPLALQEKIRSYAQAGGNIMVSGSSIATDLWDSYNVTDEGKKFAEEVLHYNWLTDYATITGALKYAGNPYGFKGSYNFTQEFNDRIYAVESPDGINAVGDGACIIYRYANNVPCATAFSGDYKVVAFGFPFETIPCCKQQAELMKEITDFFAK